MVNCRMELPNRLATSLDRFEYIAKKNTCFTQYSATHSRTRGVPGGAHNEYVDEKPPDKYMISCYVDLEILSSDTYRISQLEPSNGRLYATTAHVIQLKAWRSWDEDDDDSSENSDDEPEMQSPKRTVRKPVLYRAFM
ncbi:hypothetical protein AVEN_163839-1 [Araneus ventricosus]|uniref:Uncharacterized protein n=1 Tax=Araneus ventricosus TaxID=182803 RepID=A0A4Y2RLB8_ARAVE|nr:hypothetical protein AVEN_163839-1 [Araneus ventricosus]